MSEVDELSARVADLGAARIGRGRRIIRAAPKRERVARGIRASILRGDYADGFVLSQDKLAALYGVNRQVVWSVLADLECEGHVARDGRNRFHVNASYASHQLQLVRNKIEHVERCLWRILVILGDNPLRIR